MTSMTAGNPCWADAMFSDLEGAKRFYGAVLGWTFSDAITEFGGYTEAYSDGKAVAAIAPPMPGQEEGSAWCLYLASPDVSETAAEIRDHGGRLLVEPMEVGELGSMCLAQDPSGVTFGVWQPGTHKGFEKVGEPGSYVWAEAFTRQPKKADAFFAGVFPYEMKRIEDPEMQMDYRVLHLDGEPVLGRMEMTPDEYPAEVPPHIQVFFAVPDCDAAVSSAQGQDGRLVYGPMDSPFGRFAALVDPQGAAFAVIDTGTTQGEMPKIV
ncbi:VOC family protein [Streptomyces sp. N2-109]|uniref:VOC family protein n=1 Tax=Streptomyces gossypii TaxID=2883101 RepID=A0ABT2JQX5_9ACTN|nr:VOC family protein [Streptomyces gossypii]MCT2589765.1 VOC family protein [Streptomyces gossypii]